MRAPHPDIPWATAEAEDAYRKRFLDSRLPNTRAHLRRAVVAFCEAKCGFIDGRVCGSCAATFIVMGHAAAEQASAEARALAQGAGRPIEIDDGEVWSLGVGFFGGSDYIARSVGSTRERIDVRDVQTSVRFVYPSKREETLTIDKLLQMGRRLT